MTAPHNPPLSPRLAEIAGYLTSSRQEVVDWVNNVPQTMHSSRPEAGRWSIAEHVEHLAIVEDGIGRAITNLIKQVQSAGAPLETDTSSMLPSVDRWNVVNAPDKIVAPDRIVPTGTVGVEEGLARMETTRARLLKALDAGNGLDLTKGSFPHPLFGTFNGYQWLVFLGQHELRHLRHMRDVVRHLSGDQSPSAVPVAAPHK